MNSLKKTAQIALFIALFAPFTAFAQTWVTPYGVVVDDYGRVLSTPPKVAIVKDPLTAYKADPGRYIISIDYKGCTSVYSHPPKTMAGKVVYLSCPK